MATVSSSGLVSGIDTATLISQLVAIDKEPITRVKAKITALQSAKTAISELRTQMTTLRSKLQDFRLNNIFDSFKTSASEDSVLTSTVSSSSPVQGSFLINVTRMASATVALSSGTIGHSINPGVSINASGMTTAVEGGTFTINGKQFTVDPATNSLNSVLSAINSSAAGVTATYNSTTDKITITNTAAGNTSVINFGATGDTSNFLEAVGVETATQATGGSGSTTVSSIGYLGGADPTKALNAVSFNAGAVTAGTFSINGVSITVDPTTDSMSDIVQLINDSGAGVTASYDATTDGMRVLSDNLGSRTITFGSASDTSNFLSITKLSSATQTAGSDSQFTVNGGPVQTRSGNKVTDAISGVTLDFKSVGTSTVTVNSDDDKIVEAVKSFITEFNNSVTKLHDLTTEGGALASDGGIGILESQMRNYVFSQVSGMSGNYDSLMSIGITTGDDFDPKAVQLLEMNEDKFREALGKDRSNVQSLFSNDSKTGVGDTLFTYVDGLTNYNGFLNLRARSNGSIDTEIKGLNDQIDRITARADAHETRLKRQFAAMEQMLSTYNSQSSALGALNRL